MYAFLADHHHQLFPPALFADVVRHGGGHPSVPAEVVATVMVLQALEGLSDREAINALRRDIAWKVACGLRLDDEGFHPTVLVYWRNRVRRSPRPRRIFDAVRQVVEATGVLRGRGRRVLDSTILADAVATQDTVTQLVAAVRRVRRLLPQAREVELGAHDYDRPGKPVCAWDDPQATQALVSGLVNDTLAVLEAVAGLARRPGRRAGRGGRAAGAGRRPGRRARPAAGKLADRPQGRHRPGDLHRGPAGPPYPQDHYRLLAALEEFGPASQAALGRRTGMDRSDVVAALNDLAGRGLVQRSLDRADRRRNVIAITPAGTSQLRLLDGVLAGVQDKLLAPLSPTERKQLTRLLARVLEHHTKREPGAG